MVATRKLTAAAASPSSPFAIGKADLIEGMARGMAVLESFDTQRQRLNATLTAARAGITRAAARRHLLTLTHLGYLETDGSYFWLSAKVLRFSGSYLASSRLPRVLQPTLNRLAAQTQQSFSSVVLDGDEVVIVARSVGQEAAKFLAYGLHLGARLPAHATSTGRMLLACHSRTDFATWLKGRKWPRLTVHTVSNAKNLKSLVSQARTQDWCVASQEHELGVFALAVPLRNMQGKVVAALNVVTTPERLQIEVMQRDLLPVLMDAANELQTLL
jgi:IclR family transcriptional regulator, pca regulon regulatory protein